MKLLSLLGLAMATKWRLPSKPASNCPTDIMYCRKCDKILIDDTGRFPARYIQACDRLIYTYRCCDVLFTDGLIWFS